MREIHESQRELASALFSGVGGRVKEVRKMVDELSELYAPGSKESSKRHTEAQAAFIRSLESVDWSTVFTVDSRYADEEEEKMRRQSDPILQHYT